MATNSFKITKNIQDSKIENQRKKRNHVTKKTRKETPVKIQFLNMIDNKTYNKVPKVPTMMSQSNPRRRRDLNLTQNPNHNSWA